MRLLLTSDWQADHRNIDLCEITLAELLKYAEEYEPDAIIHAGDLKEPYDPIPATVLKFWVRAVRTINKAGYRFIILKGNHDRISQSNKSKDWLDVMRAAGAETVSKPRWKVVGDGQVAFLPYTADKKLEAKWASSLADHTPGTPSALIFHTEVHSAELNAAGIKTKGITPEDLHADAYHICMGGHLHGHQQLAGSNIHYIGSPFCMDWSEVNQRKGHVLVEVGKPPKNGGIRAQWQQLPTSIPGWYDIEYLEANNITPEAGAMVRSRVPVSSKKITEQIDNEESRLQMWAKQNGVGGMRTFVVPRLEVTKTTEIELTGKTDDENIAQYVAATISDEAVYTAGGAVEYLTSKLGQTSSGVIGKQLRFISAKGKRILSFEEINIDYRNQGLIMLKGINRDWGRRSNGSGKTNALSLLPVILHGTTLKDQKNDAWASERSSEGAVGVLTLRDEQKRKIEIERHRPHRLLLRIDGADVSTGLTGKGKAETQGLIEQVTGFDMRMLTNSVYIDQTIANGFVFGTQKDRMDLIAKLLDLSRYEAALKAVKADITLVESLQRPTATKLSRLEYDRQTSEDAITELEAELTAKTPWKAKAKEARQAVTTVQEELQALKSRAKAIEKAKVEVRTLEEEIDRLNGQVRKSEAVVLAAKKDLVRAKDLIKAGNCPQCGQPAKKVGQAVLESADAVVNAETAKKRALEETLTAKTASYSNLETKIDLYEDEVREHERQLVSAQALLTQAETGEREEAVRTKGIHAKLVKQSEKLLSIGTEEKQLQAQVRAYEVQQALYQYAAKAFNRTGIPMYLAAGMCPMLNSFAEEYSELFTDGKLKLLFKVEDGEFVAEVINPAGSQDRKGQSVGESASAGLVAAFSLREAAPKTNLLVLDEPAHGLDAEGARKFAQGLLKLKDRFETIIITTHSPVIESILSGETTWTVEKRKGVSRLVTE